MTLWNLTPMEIDKLYQQYSKKIRIYLARFVNETDAEDLMQEVFFKVSDSIDKFRGEASIKTWIYRIATNVAKDYLKSKSHKIISKQTSISESELEECDVLFEPNKSVDDEIDAKERAKCIKEFIDRLPINYSGILFLSELENLSNKEVAKIMDLSTGTVKVRLHRAKARLKKELEKGCAISTSCDGNLICERK